MANTPPIRIRIGASVDASVGRAFDDVAKKQTKASDEAAKSAAKAAKAQEQAAIRAAKAQEREQGAATRATERELAKQTRAAEREAKAQERALERSMRWKQNILNRHYQQQDRDRKRDEARSIRSQERAAESFARRTSHRTTRFLGFDTPMTSLAARGVGGLVRGLGADLSVAGSVGRSVSLEAQATKISNSGYLPNGTGANATRVNPADLVKDARSIAGKYGLDAATALDALDAFATRAGDLDAGRKALEQMAGLSAATGTELGDMASASAAVFEQLEGDPDRLKKTLEVIRTIAGQGKLGAVEMSDMANQMSRVAASANKFEGDAAENIKTFGGLVQFAKATGGATSAADASRASASFANTFSKSARIAAFRAEGINVKSKETGKIRDPVDLVVEALDATGGDLERMNKMFMDVLGGKIVTGVTQEWLNAEKSKKGSGAAAVRAKVQEMRDVAPTDAEIEESSRRASNTRAARAARFQNQFDEAVEAAAAELVPALESLSDEVIDLVGILGRVTTYAVENPKTAIMAAIGLSIARAGIESALRSGVEKMLSGAGIGADGISGYNKKAGFGGGVGVAGNLSAGLAIASLGVAAFTVGTMTVDYLIDKSKEEADRLRKEDAATLITDQKIRAALEAGDLAKAKELAEKNLGARESVVGKQQDVVDKRFWQMAAEALMTADPFGGGGAFSLAGKDGADAIDARDNANKALLEQQKEELRASHATLEEILQVLRENSGVQGRVPQ